MISIKGIVIPADWDTQGNVISLAIATRDEQEYLIENHQQVAKLKSYLRQEVAVSGTLKHRGRRIIIQIASIN